MTSTNGTSPGGFDERLVEVLKGVLIDGEEVMAQGVGDQGQAIVLTGSRIIIVKAGLAATGELNGHRASAFALDSITAVNLRKGPLGAVIQVCAEDAQSIPEGTKPDNVVVFTGPGRVKKADLFAAAVESAVGKAVNRVDSRTGEQHVDKAIAQPQEAVEVLLHASAVAPEPPIDATMLEVEDEEEEELVPSAAYNPNPLLPKAVRKHDSGPNRLLVALGVLATLVFVGMAVMAPLRDAQNNKVFGISLSKTGELDNMRLQLIALSKYSSEVKQMLRKADADANALKAMVRAGNKPAILSASRSSATDQALQKLSALPALSGLAEAKENLTGGLLARKNAITAAATAAGSPDPVGVRETLSRFEEAEAQINKGLSTIIAARTAAEKQVAELARRAKHAKVH